MPKIKNTKRKVEVFKPKRAADISYIGRDLQMKVYNLIKELLNSFVANQNNLYFIGAISSGCRTRKDEYQILIYSCTLWDYFFIEGLRQCIQEYWHSVYSYNTVFLIETKEIEYGDLCMYICKTELLGEIESGMNLCYHNFWV